MMLIVDAFNTLYASYHALAGTLTTSPAQAALYGFFQTLLGRLRNEPQYSYVFLCMDNGRGFRHDLYPEYKANRNVFKSDKEKAEKEAIREGITHALAVLRGLQPHMPWFHVERPNTEGDDLVAKLCMLYKDVPKQIVSGDDDMLQLINPYTSVYRRGKNVVVAAHLFESAVSINHTVKGKKEKKFFANAMEWLVFRLLTGDTSDNIPGVPGIGDVKGHQIVKCLFTKFDGRVQTLLDQPEKVLATAGVTGMPKLAALIKEEGAAILNRNMSLMSLVEAAERIDDMPACIYSGNWEVGRDFFASWLMENNFPSLMGELPRFDEMWMKNQQMRTA